MKYITTGVAALGALAFAAQADAADIYAPGPGPAPFPVMAPVALWSGMYGGVHIGGAWANLNTADLDHYWANDYNYLRSIAYLAVRGAAYRPVAQRRFRRRHDRL